MQIFCFKLQSFRDAQTPLAVMFAVLMLVTSLAQCTECSEWANVAPSASEYNLQEQSEDAVGHKYLIIAAYFISSSDALHFRRIECYQFKLAWSTAVFLVAGPSVLPNLFSALLLTSD